MLVRELTADFVLHAQKQGEWQWFVQTCFLETFFSGPGCSSWDLELIGRKGLNPTLWGYGTQSEAHTLERNCRYTAQLQWEKKKKLVVEAGYFWLWKLNLLISYGSIQFPFSALYNFLKIENKPFILYYKLFFIFETSAVPPKYSRGRKYIVLCNYDFSHWLLGQVIKKVIFCIKHKYTE